MSFVCSVCDGFRPLASYHGAWVGCLVCTASYWMDVAFVFFLFGLWEFCRVLFRVCRVSAFDAFGFALFFCGRIIEGRFHVVFIGMMAVFCYGVILWLAFLFLVFCFYFYLI